MEAHLNIWNKMYLEMKKLQFHKIRRLQVSICELSAKTCVASNSSKPMIWGGGYKSPEVDAGKQRVLCLLPACPKTPDTFSTP